MVLKTFSVEESIYSRFAQFCKARGLSMSRQIQMFMEAFTSTEPNAKKEYLKKLGEIRKGRFIKVQSFAERYGL